MAVHIGLSGQLNRLGAHAVKNSVRECRSAACRPAGCSRTRNIHGAVGRGCRFRSRSAGLSLPCSSMWAQETTACRTTGSGGGNQPAPVGGEAGQEFQAGVAAHPPGEPRRPPRDDVKLAAGTASTFRCGFTRDPRPSARSWGRNCSCRFGGAGDRFRTAALAGVEGDPMRSYWIGISFGSWGIRPFFGQRDRGPRGRPGKHQVFPVGVQCGVACTKAGSSAPGNGC